MTENIKIEEQTDDKVKTDENRQTDKADAAEAVKAESAEKTSDKSDTESEVPETPHELSFDYQVMKLLGEGSYGKTYLAKDLHTGEYVAIKELKTVNDFKSLDLFKREAEVLESLSVAGIPKFYKSIIPEANALSSSCYIIQEYVKYPSIQTTLNEDKKFTEKETIEIIKGITAILNILQTKYVPAIIHRDIKPSNIMYEKMDDIFKVYLIDFGAVANPQKRGGGSTIAGTLGYMAPEQHLGDCVIQSDFYSLGATALHMLTGVAPYKMDSTGFELDYQSAIDTYAPETSLSMRILLGWLMETRYENRPSTAADVMRAITCVQNGLDPRASSVENDNGDSQAGSGNLDDTEGKLCDRNGVVLKKELDLNKKIDLNTWKKAVGTVWSMSYLDASPIYEYTFVVDGRTWGGSIMENYIIHHSGRIPTIFPFKCMALYDPDDPRRNVIFIKTEEKESVVVQKEKEEEKYEPKWMNVMNLASLNTSKDLDYEWDTLMTDEAEKTRRPNPNRRNIR